ncbi:uncharacterized protein LOC135204139 isoform X1 [Macrobrachium nipponense]|uniref:uncharacterized protein LOC135204139 isoform X1 n=2 Tax=Macrobrachium nipponense TaxID=159736 RepID=UPI0030C859EC
MECERERKLWWCCSLQRKTFHTMQPKPTIQSWSPWRKGWPRLLWSMCVSLYILGLSVACIALVLVRPITAAGSLASDTYTISGPLYQGNVFSGATKGDRLKTIRLNQGRDGAVQHQAMTCTRACHQTPGCHTFVIRGDECYLTSFDACKNAGRRFLLEWEGATTYELRAGSDDDLHQTCLAQCLETQGCGGCGRPLCNGTFCDNCPSTCWDIYVPKVGYTIIYPTLSIVKKVKCDGKWQRWWKNGRTSLYHSLVRKRLILRVVIHYKTGITLESEFENFKYKNNTISVGKFLNGTAGNGWNAPFDMRLASTPPDSSCRKFFYSKGACKGNGVASYHTQQAANSTKIQYGYSWKTGDRKVDDIYIISIELWITPQES